MDDLDLLKKSWQKLDNFNQVSEQDIYGMLHKKSSSIVKWLLIISVLEFLLWTVFSLIYDTSEVLKNNDEVFYFDLLEYFGYCVILLFMFLLYKNYKKISTTGTTKQLMADILKTKKIVNYYVFYNLIMIVLAFIICFGYVFFINPDNVILKEKFLNNPKLLFGFIIGLFLVLAVILSAFWLFYKLLYGILLKKLYSNYEELKKIDF